MPSSDPGAAPLLVSTGGGVFVASDTLLAELPALSALAEGLESDAHRLDGLAAVSSGEHRELGRAAHLGRELAVEVRRIRTALIVSEANYTTTERVARSAQDVLAELVAAWLPRGVLPALPSLAAGLWLGSQLAPGTARQRRVALQRWMLDHPELITSPAFANLVRRAVSGVDDAALGAAGAPPLLGLLLGEHGLGLLGVRTSAAAIVGVGTLSDSAVFHETPVRTERIAVEHAVDPPVGAAERLARVPAEQQLRIERYSAPGEDDRFVVYIAPTQTFSPVADREPWDLTSNIAGVAGLPAGSIRATEQAMLDAGIAPGSPVVLVGFSQGGLVADALAGSGRWNAVGLETYGDPGGSIELPDGIRGVAVRHSDDFVVALGGTQQPTDRVIVERQAYPDGAPIPHELPAPAHQRAAYAQTAQLLDAARSPQLRAELDALDAFTGELARRDGATVTSISYHAIRVPDGLDAATARVSEPSSGAAG